MQKPIGTWLLFIFAATFVALGHAQLATALTIQATQKTQYFTLAELLSHAHTQTLTLTRDLYYPKTTVHYRTINLCDLLAPFGLQKDDLVQVTATDHFSATIPANTFFPCSTHQTKAYLGVEDPKHPWPKLGIHGNDHSAGPLALLWDHATQITPEFWSFQVTRIDIFKAADAPIKPPKTRNAHILKGYHVFMQQCAGCHRLGKEGLGHVGPNLNDPMNPTDYFKPQILKRYIRNPQSVREFENERMSSFPKSVISDPALNDLIYYLRYKAKQGSQLSWNNKTKSKED